LRPNYEYDHQVLTQRVHQEKRSNHGIVSAHEFASLGEDFEKKEDELFGDDGFFKVVDRVAAIEKKLGIYDLSQFTPK
jgi:hypothetical protein